MPFGSGYAELGQTASHDREQDHHGEHDRGEGPAADDVDVCAPRPYADHGGRMAAALQPVVDARPASASSEPLRLRFLPTDIEHLQRPVRARLDGWSLPEGVVPLSFSHHEGEFGVARLKTAASIVGLPVGPNAPESTLVDGEARGVVLLWLATRGLDEESVTDLLVPYDSSTPTLLGHLWPGVCAADVQWAPQDVAAAWQLHRADQDHVTAVVSRSWSMWISPSTTSDELLVAAGLSPQGSPEPIEPLGPTC